MIHRRNLDSAARGARRSAERRRGQPQASHHRGDPATTDREYSPEEAEYLRAVDLWRARTGRPFPTACDFLAILKSLGYSRMDPPGAAG